jgi:molybdopterin synthase catalytic subunit
MHSNPIISVQFVEGEVDIQKHSTLPTTGCGGECLFVGRTRPEHHDKHGELLELSYDCYQTLAQTKLEQLANEAVARFGVRTINICHSTGSVPINGVSVVIAVASEHRDDAFHACRFLIDLLKLHVPIWKQEIWEDGTTWSAGVPLPNELKT